MCYFFVTACFFLHCSVLSVFFFFGQVKNSHRVEITANLKGTSIHCRTETPDMYESIDAVAHALVRYFTFLMKISFVICCGSDRFSFFYIHSFRAFFLLPFPNQNTPLQMYHRMANCASTRNAEWMDFMEAAKQGMI